MMKVYDAVEFIADSLTNEEKDFLESSCVNKEFYEKLLTRVTSLIVYSEV